MRSTAVQRKRTQGARRFFVETSTDLHAILAHRFPLSQPWPTDRTMVADSPSVFRPFLQEFFVKASDPLFTCTLKLDVLTALVTQENCATILGELQTYVLHRDKSFVCAAVRAVGRVADARPEAADQCLHVSFLCWLPAPAPAPAPLSDLIFGRDALPVSVI